MDMQTPKRLRDRPYDEDVAAELARLYTLNRDAYTYRIAKRGMDPKLATRRLALLKRAIEIVNGN